MDWGTFVRKIRIKSSVAQVYHAWADKDQISKWFLKSCIILGPDQKRDIVETGDKVEWIWYNYPHPMTIDILEAKENESLSFTFGEGMEVLVSIVKKGGYSELTLTQTNIPTDEKGKYNYHLGCSRAWSTWMLNLKAWLEFGIILHDTTLGHTEDLFDYVNT